MNNDHEKEQGSVAVIAAVSMVGLLSVVALGVDVGHVLIVRNQTQNAVDAAAVRGAAFLYPQGSGSPDFTSGGPAVTNATATVPLNTSVTGNDTLSVAANYWQSLNASAPSNQAAVQVSLTKQVQLYFASVFGLSSTHVSASATAVVQAPTTMGPGAMNVPMAIGSCMFSQYWDDSNNSPRNDPETNQPYVFKIGPSYAYGNNQEGGHGEGGNCNSGQWTPLSGNQDNSDNTIQQCIDNGNSTTLQANKDQIWLQNGDKNNLYDSINNCSKAGNGTCEYATVPVVNSVSSGSEQSISAMACLHVLSATGGSGKYILAQMSAGCTPNNASGTGLAYGVVSPPKLAQ